MRSSTIMMMKVHDDEGTRSLRNWLLLAAFCHSLRYYARRT
jgi:hypothetical protein